MPAPNANPATRPLRQLAAAARAAGAALATPRGATGAALVALALGLLWSCWTTLGAVAERWARDPEYSHGFLVPVFALVVLWHRRARCPVRGLEPEWGGLVLLAIGAAMRLVAAPADIAPLDAFSLLPTVAGLVWVAFGRATLLWAWPAVAFLAFMLPLPFSVEGLLAQPLRRVATTASTYTLQCLGYPALAEGNQILIEDVRLGVADACSGLGMLVTFFALSTAVALILQPSWLDRAVIVVSAVPIALVANIARITLTGVVHVESGAAAGKFVHDHGGWLMMPLALALLWVELRYLARLFPVTDPRQPLALPLRRSPPEAPDHRFFPLRAARADAPHEPPSPSTASHHDSLSETR
jgi:exosortase